MQMRGRYLVIGLLAVLAIFAGALWYFQNHAYYRELPQERFLVMGTEYPVESWSGIDADTSPLKLRICLTVTPEVAQKISDDNFHLRPIEALVAPYWFDCFDARQITRDLESGRAELFLIGPARMTGADVYLALYADGRGFVWSHLKEEFRE